MLITRKNDEAYVLDLPDDVMEAIQWHVREGFSGPEFLFSDDGEFPKYVDSHKRPLREVQRELGLDRVDVDVLPKRKGTWAVLPKAWPGRTSLGLDCFFRS